MRRSTRQTRTIASAALVLSLLVHFGTFGVIYRAAKAEPSEPPLFGAGRTIGETFEVSEYDSKVEGLGVADSSGAGASEPGEESVPVAPAVPKVESSPRVVTASEAEVSVPAKPEPRRATRTSRAAVASSVPSNTESVSAGSGSPGGGTFGSAGLAAEKGYFPDSFTRVLPLAAQGLRGFYDAEPGWSTKLLLRVSIGEDGKVVSIVPKGEFAPHVGALLRSCQILMRAGHFALPQGSRGDFLVGLSVLAEQEAAAFDASDDPPKPTAVRGLSHTAPSQEKPGIALVRYASGKSITLSVFVNPDPRDY